ncbi:hypothetical protein M8I34_26120 [Streptomyces sp. MCA2]|uniref:hypothetical protein n=1 Tax=Streptomyces sp. MCA2 TaxID=2944805 RepID=UPI0020222B5C|nr:hypothetical protein [Streptomyces sp. MCA2]MCL7494850.1 hypothetical protein [Streptomyces sp. MCA2]
MSELEVLQLAAPAAQVLVSCMVTDAWLAAKERFARLLGRGNEEHASAIDADLEEARSAVVDGDPNSTVVTEVWRARFRQALLANPEMAGELRDLLAEIETPNAQSRTVHQSIVARDHAVAFQQGSGTQNYYGQSDANDK